MLKNKFCSSVQEKNPLLYSLLEAKEDGVFQNKNYRKNAAVSETNHGRTALLFLKKGYSKKTVCFRRRSRINKLSYIDVYSTSSSLKGFKCALCFF